MVIGSFKRRNAGPGTGAGRVADPTAEEPRRTQRLKEGRPMDAGHQKNCTVPNY